jgi:hypothetical protein
MPMIGCAISRTLLGSDMRPGGVRLPFSDASGCAGGGVGPKSDPIEGMVVALLRDTSGGGIEEVTGVCSDGAAEVAGLRAGVWLSRDEYVDDGCA